MTAAVLQSCVEAATSSAAERPKLTCPARTGERRISRTLLAGRVRRGSWFGAAAGTVRPQLLDRQGGWRPSAHSLGLVLVTSAPPCIVIFCDFSSMAVIVPFTLIPLSGPSVGSMASTPWFSSHLPRYAVFSPRFVST